MNFERLNYSVPIDSTPFIDLLTKERKDLIGKSKIKLQPKEFKAWIAELYTYGLLDAKKPGVNNLQLYSDIMFNKLELLKYVKVFSHHLLNNLDADKTEDLASLAKLKYNIIKPFSNHELSDFVDEQLLDVTFSYRKCEFGQFILQELGRNEIDKSVLDFVDEGFKSSELNFQDQLFKIMDHFNLSLKLSETEKVLLSMIVKNKVDPERMTMADFLSMGSFFQSNLIAYSKRIKIINSEMQYLKNKKLFIKDNGKRRGARL
ncbi:hypothetical protein [Maribacter forsetii]|uniref:hypothetical protein n=1 Tax=Maribacter forsetii TaxID=444515 RepID=UPI000559C88C|nr:hypothetical protein [Maribacter forsetii]